MNNRSNRATLAEETVSICGAGVYTGASGKSVSIAEWLAASGAGTRHWTPEALSGLAPSLRRYEKTLISVTGETTLAAASRLAHERGEEGLVALNFASAKNPGGGFLGGSSAQEESIARSSGLYPTLLKAPAYYDTNRAHRSNLYTDHMIFSPAVPVFRDDAGALLEQPYRLSIVTAPAPNAGAVKEEERPLVEPTLRRRAELILRLCAQMDMRTVILGAWGCGVFRNDPAAVARVFGDLLAPAGPYARTFEAVCFAVFDPSEAGQTLGSFRSVFPDTR